MSDILTLPSAHQIGDSVWFNLWSKSLVAEIAAVHFYAGKVKYSLDVNVRGFDDEGNGTTRLINIDSVFVSKIHPDHQSEQ